MATKDPFDVWEKEIDPRIDDLRKNGYYLESFYLLSNTIEFVLRSSIISQESWIENVLHKSGLSFKKLSEKELDKKTLGSLIKLFGKHYTPKDDLISKLEKFNSFRIDIIHKILKNDISYLNKKANVSYFDYNEIVAKICRYNVFLNKKQILKAKRRIKKYLKK